MGAGLGGSAVRGSVRGSVWTTVVSALPARHDELRRLDRAVRRPLPLSTRVGFVGVAGGVGCSVAAGLTASVLAARRPHRVLAVNASGSARSLLWHAGLAGSAPSAPADEVARRAARDSAAATAGLVRTPGGLHCLDLVAPDAPARDARWWEAVAPAGRFFDFVVTDWGVRDASSVGAAVSASTLVCVVAAADRTSLQRGVDLARSVQDAGVGALLVAVDVRGRRPAAVRELVRLLPLDVAGVGHDRAHGAAAAVPSSRLRASTTLAALRLAAAVVDRAGTSRTGASRVGTSRTGASRVGTSGTGPARAGAQVAA